jgi:AcrR family transcriptional regulator
LDSAENALSEKSYLTVTIDDIVGGAGTSRATFYLHFASKDEVVSALLERWLEFTLDRYAVLDEILAEPDADGRQAMRQWFLDWITIFRNRAQYTLGVNQAASADPAVAQQELALHPAILDSLKNAAWLKDPVRKRATRRQRALMLQIMMQRLLLVVAIGGLPDVKSDDVVADFLTDLWWEIYTDPSRS